MNILYFDITAIVLMIIMFILNWIQGTTKGRTNHLFMVMTLFGIASAVGDFLSGYGSNYFAVSETNRVLLYAFNYLYFFSHNNITYIYFFYCFSSMGIWHKIMRGKILRWVIIVSCVLNNLCIFINFFDNKIFYIDDDMNYKRGDYMFVIYLFAFSMMLLGTVLIFWYKKTVTLDKFIVLAAIVPLNIFAILIQMVWSNVLIETYALAIEIAILALVVQRQDEMMDPIIGAKKYSNMLEEVKSKYITGAPFSITFIKIKNETSVSVYLGQIGYGKFLHMVSDRINEIKEKTKVKGDLYYIEYGLYAVVSEQHNSSKNSEFAEKIAEMFSYPLIMGDFEINIDEMICVVECPDDINEYQTLVTFAMSLHNTSMWNKNIFYYREYINDSEFIINNKMSDIIKRSLEEKQFKVYYQPIYSVKEEKYVAIEALLRLHDRKYGDISPAQFIPVAEQNGDIHAIGAYVLEEVCRFISKNKLREYDINQVQINLSASQCVESDLPDKVFATLEKYNIDANLISFEISESTADIDQIMVDSNIKLMHEKGIQFALDDYGTGYSNVKRVTSLPISLIKLGRKFVNDLEDINMKIIVDDTIRMFKAIGMKVLVEGIEDEEKAKYFTELGCDYIQGSEYLQGFYFCRPISEKDCIEFIKKNYKK